MATNLSQDDFRGLMKEGYTVAEINEAVREVEQEELRKSFNTTQQNIDPRAYSQQSAFAPMMQDNLIKWQLELDNILERAEHILRGDVIVHEQGHLIWKKNPNTENNILNEYGVQEVMRILSMYLNRNTILSDYFQVEIQEKVLDFGREISDLFFMKYETIGLITLEKRKNYPMLMREIIDTVHSAYKRALAGGERRSLREARSVTQTEPLYPMGAGGRMMPPNMTQQKTRGTLNPLRYVLGKYK